MVRQLTDIAADAANDPALASRTWVLLTEAPDGGWGLSGHANTNEELVAAARAQIAELRAKAAQTERAACEILTDHPPRDFQAGPLYDVNLPGPMPGIADRWCPG